MSFQSTIMILDSHGSRRRLPGRFVFVKAQSSYVPLKRGWNSPFALFRGLSVLSFPLHRSGFIRDPGCLRVSIRPCPSLGRGERGAFVPHRGRCLHVVNLALSLPEKESRYAAFPLRLPSSGHLFVSSKGPQVTRFGTASGSSLPETSFPGASWRGVFSLVPMDRPAPPHGDRQTPSWG